MTPDEQETRDALLDDMSNIVHISLQFQGEIINLVNAGVDPALFQVGIQEPA